MATWRSEVDRALILCGQTPTADNSTFDSDTSLDKIQLQAKYAYSRAYMRLWREGRWRFNEREYSITTSDGTTDYNVTSATAPEFFVEGSFRLTSPSASAKAPIVYMTYEDYTRAFPQGNGTAEGIPDYWVLLPPDGTGTDKIRFYPTPAGTYTVKYRAYLQPADLSSATSTITFPDAVRDILVEFAQVYIESMLGEGKQAEFVMLFEQALTAAKAIYRGPVDEKSRLNMGMQIDGRRLYINRGY